MNAGVAPFIMVNLCSPPMCGHASNLNGRFGDPRGIGWLLCRAHCDRFTSTSADVRRVVTLRCCPVPRILFLIGADFAMADDFVQALADELSPVVEAGADPRRALQDLVAAGVRAAVVSPERELRSWFSWQWYRADSLAGELVRDGRLRRINGHVTAAG
jgi:hypothetical protein